MPRRGYSTAVQVAALYPGRWLRTVGTPPSHVSYLHVGSRVPALLGLRVAAGAPASPSVRVYRDVPDRFVRQPVHTYF